MASIQIEIAELKPLIAEVAREILRACPPLADQNGQAIRPMLMSFADIARETSISQKSLRRMERHGSLPLKRVRVGRAG